MIAPSGGRGLGTRWILLLTLASAVGAGAAPIGAEADDPRRLAKSANAFGIELYQRLRARPGSLAISPASVGLALTMAWGGARGETAARMGEALRLEGSPAELLGASGRLLAALTDRSRPVTLRIANRLFGEETYRFEPAFLVATGAAHVASLEPVDFRGAPEAARRRINGWVEGETENRIQGLVPPGGVDRETRLAIVNALYFLGNWQAPFAAEATRPAPFFTSRTGRKDVPTMHRTDTFRLAARDGLRALELPYRGAGVSMLILLPDAVDGLDAVEQTLTPQVLEALLSALAPRQVALALPKFDVNPPGSLALADALTAMGMAVAFDRQRADFRGIADPADPGDRLHIGQVFHRAFVKVDEKGTEAAAATAVTMPRAASAPVQRPAVEFKADRPFLFLLRDQATGLLLFLGRMTDPLAT